MTAPTSPAPTPPVPAGSAGLPARAAALDLVRAAFARRGGLDEALARPPYAALDPQARPFARALAMTVLRRRGSLDRMLDARLRTPPPEGVRDLLRLGAAQILHMDVPAFAAVSTTLALAQSAPGTRPFKGLINAVLRGAARDAEAGAAPPEDPRDLVPAWLFARWSAAYGEAEALDLARRLAEEPPTDLTPRVPGLDPEPLQAEVLPGGSLRTRRRGDLAAWPGYAAGDWWVQDAAAAVPARLLPAGPGRRALDMCAAPGGKTLQLAAAGAETTALDRSAARLARVRENLQRTGLRAELKTADAAGWRPEAPFDDVLLDAPCTSTGTYRRNPDVLWALSPGDVAKMAGVQARLLDAAAEAVRPGGRLVYCVCSLEPEEGEAQAAAFLARRPDFRTDPVRPAEGGAPPAAATAEGWLRILPSHLAGGADGFFVARFARAADGP